MLLVPLIYLISFTDAFAPWKGIGAGEKSQPTKGRGTHKETAGESLSFGIFSCPVCSGVFHTINHCTIWIIPTGLEKLLLSNK